MMLSAEQFFHGSPQVSESAPGRINLLGEHTDYNDGYMLPTATPQRTTVALAPSPDRRHHLYSATLGRHRLLPNRPKPARARPDFERYVDGCIKLIEARGTHVPPLSIHISSALPIGAGLSSSAALEVALLRALRRLLRLDLDDLGLARLAQQAEITYAGVHCGILDQMACSLADCAHMLWIDARTLASRLLPLPSPSALVVIDSGVARALAATGYNRRRAECETAARLLGVPALRDIRELAALDTLPPPYRQRARHVLTENARVLQAAGGLSPEQFGSLMNASHASLRDDFEVSLAALDELVALLQTHPQVYGARLTGAGFGGACVALCRQGSAHDVALQTLQKYQAHGHRPSILLPPCTKS